jgi:hypothetical protein
MTKLSLQARLLGCAFAALLAATTTDAAADDTAAAARDAG